MSKLPKALTWLEELLSQSSIVDGKNEFLSVEELEEHICDPEATEDEFMSDIDPDYAYEGLDLPDKPDLLPVVCWDIASPLELLDGPPAPAHIVVFADGDQWEIRAYSRYEGIQQAIFSSMEQECHAEWYVAMLLSDLPQVTESESGYEVEIYGYEVDWEGNTPTVTYYSEGQQFSTISPDTWSFN